MDPDMKKPLRRRFKLIGVAALALGSLIVLLIAQTRTDCSGCKEKPRTLQDAKPVLRNVSDLGLPYHFSAKIESVEPEEPRSSRVSKTKEGWSLVVDNTSIEIFERTGYLPAVSNTKVKSEQVLFCHRPPRVTVKSISPPLIAVSDGECRSELSGPSPSQKMFLSESLIRKYALARLVEVGAVSPAEFEGQIGPNSKEVLGYFLQGGARPLEEPFSASLTFKGVKFDVRGKILIKRSAYYHPKFDENSTLQMKGEVGLYEFWARNINECSANLTDPLTARWCATIRGFLSEGRNRIYLEDWPRIPAGDPSEFMNMVALDGSTMPMRYLESVCRKNEYYENTPTNKEKFEAAKAEWENSFFSKSLDVNQRDKFGRTIFFYAAASGCEFEKLSRFGVDLRDKDYYGNSLLAYAVFGRGASQDLVGSMAEHFSTEEILGNSLAWPSSIHESLTGEADLQFYSVDRALQIPARPPIVAIASRHRDQDWLVRALLKGRRLSARQASDLAKFALTRGKPKLLLSLEQMGVHLDSNSDSHGVTYPAIEYLEERKGTLPVDEATKEKLLQTAESARSKKFALCTTKKSEEVCIKEAELCSKYPTPNGRDTCYSSHRQCSLVQDAGMRWRCSVPFYFSGNVDSRCAGAKFDQDEFALCGLRSAESVGNIDRIGRLVSSEKGIEKFLSEFPVRGLAPRLEPKDAENFYKHCQGKKYGMEVRKKLHTYCAYLLEKVMGSTERRLITESDRCIDRGTFDECFVSILYVTGRDEAKRQKILDRICGQGERAACEELGGAYL